MRQYIALIHKEEGTSYGISFPDFPGCVSAGDTVEEALASGESALAAHAGFMVEEGRALPAPSKLDAVMADPENRGALAVLVPLNPAVVMMDA